MRSPYKEICALLRVAKATGEILASSAFKRLEFMLAQALAKSTAGHVQSEGTFNLGFIGDDRYCRPIFRRVSSLGLATPPLPTDPPVMRGVTPVLTPVYRDMFEFGANIFLNPRSALSRIGEGFALYKQTPLKC